MAQVIEFYYDFTSPYSYLAHKRLQQLKDEYDAIVEYKPVLLGGIFKATENRPPIAVAPKGSYMLTDLQRYATRYRVPFRMNPYFPINSVKLMRGALAAKQQGNLEQYSDAIFQAMWEDGKALGDDTVIADVLNKAGLNGSELLAANDDAPIKEQLRLETDKAVERGLFGVPTMIMGAEIYFGQDRMFFIEEQLTTKASF